MLTARTAALCAVGLIVLAIAVSGHALKAAPREPTPAELAAPALSESLAAAINGAKSTWTASAKQGPRVGGTLADARQLMGVRKNTKGGSVPKRAFQDIELSQPIPDSFDSAAHWPLCPTITQIRDQSDCGSCWAVAAAETISDRYCTMGGPTELPISADNLMTCCDACGAGCQGGDPDSAMQYWQTNGILTESCQPYPFPKCDHHIAPKNYPACPATEYNTPNCSANCSSPMIAPQLFFANDSYSLSGVSAFQLELMTRGPFEVAFSVYQDFLFYQSGVYQQTSNVFLGGHAVKLVGWGSLNGTAYWKIANSWNRDWGMEGYFLILRGADECGIEDAGSAGTPLLTL